MSMNSKTRLPAANAGSTKDAGGCDPKLVVVPTRVATRKSVLPELMKKWSLAKLQSALAVTHPRKWVVIPPPLFHGRDVPLQSPIAKEGVFANAVLPFTISRVAIRILVQSVPMLSSRERLFWLRDAFTSLIAE
jgi:hypothetical protein